MIFTKNRSKHSWESDSCLGITIEYKWFMCLKIRTIILLFFLTTVIIFPSFAMASLEKEMMESVLEKAFVVEVSKVKMFTEDFVVPTAGVISSSFGIRIHPVFGSLHFHKGIDIASLRVQPVLAAQSGVVIFAGDRGGYGRSVILIHEFGWSTSYSHLEKFNVRVGDHVGTGATLGRMGNTGVSTGQHLHFEILYNGTPLDPLLYLARS